MDDWQVIHLHHAAPPKPAPGSTCNGCGVCCAAATCPAARVLFQCRSACPALRWQADHQRYQCGLLSAPEHHLRWLPQQLIPLARRAFARWIAAGKGCDSLVEIETSSPQ